MAVCSPSSFFNCSVDKCVKSSFLWHWDENNCLWKRPVTSADSLSWGDWLWVSCLKASVITKCFNSYLLGSWRVKGLVRQVYLDVTVWHPFEFKKGILLCNLLSVLSFGGDVSMNQTLLGRGSHWTCMSDCHGTVIIAQNDRCCNFPMRAQSGPICMNPLELWFHWRPTKDTVLVGL